MAEEKRNTDVNGVLHELIGVLEDGHEGMMDLAKHLKNESTKQFFLRESQVRAEYAAELQNELHRRGEHDVKREGTAGGAIHRWWGEVKAHLGGGDHTLLATAERGEDGTKDAYQKALDEELPGDLREMLLRQQRHILQAHNEVRSLRDQAA